MVFMLALRDYHAKVHQALAALDQQLDFATHASYVAQPKAALTRRTAARGALSVGGMAMSAYARPALERRSASMRRTPSLLMAGMGMGQFGRGGGGRAAGRGPGGT